MNNRTNSLLKWLLFSLIILVVLSFGVIRAGGETAGEITSFTVSVDGTAEVTGYFNAPEIPTATLLLVEGDDITNDLVDDQIIAIDQRQLGNNGSFYFRVRIRNEHSLKTVTLGIGGNGVLKKTITLPEIQGIIAAVSNNALRVGNDIYDIGHSAYTPDNISASIEEGGNTIYYKIGDMWFNMLSEDATSIEYFVTANAEPENTVKGWKIDCYYHF